MSLLLDRSDSLPAAVARAKILEALSGNVTVEDMMNMVRGYGYQPVAGNANYRRWRATLGTNNIDQGWFICSDSNSCLCFIGGIERDRDARFVWDGYTGAQTSNLSVDRTPYNPAFRALANYFLRAPIRQHFDRQTVILCGHSAGGAILVELKSELAAPVYAINRIALIGFGVPKICFEPRTYLQEFPERTFWLNSDDPVPMIPPDPGTWNRIAAGLGTNHTRRIAMFSYNYPAIQVSLSGAVLGRMDPSEVAGPPVDAVTRWLRDTESGIPTSHSIATYVARLTLAAQLNADVPEADTGGSSGGGSYEMTETAARRIVEAAGATMFTIADAQAGVSINIPPANLLTVRRVGRTYWILLGGVEVACAPYRRRAHGLARAGNDFLRRLQKEAFVDTQQIVPLLQQYFAQAQDPTGPFRPVMQGNG